MNTFILGYVADVDVDVVAVVAVKVSLNKYAKCS